MTSSVPFTRRAFTLIELLTVIAIIGILAAILIPVVGSVRATAKTAQCQSNLRQLATALLLFPNDNRGFLPRAVRPQHWSKQITSYIPTDTGTNTGKLINKVYLCPAEELPPDGNTVDIRHYSASYALEAGVSITDPNGRPRPFATIPKPSKAILLADGGIDPTTYTSLAAPTFSNIGPQLTQNDPKASFWLRFRHKDAVNLAFADGHVSKVTWADRNNGVITSDNWRGR